MTKWLIWAAPLLLASLSSLVAEATLSRTVLSSFDDHIELKQNLRSRGDGGDDIVASNNKQQKISSEIFFNEEEEETESSKQRHLLSSTTGQHHRKLVTMQVTSSFMVRNDFDLTAGDLSGGLSPQGTGILNAFNGITAKMMVSMPHVEYVRNSASVISIADSPCPTNCREVDKNFSKCQKISTMIEIEVDEGYASSPETAQEEVSDVLSNLIQTGQLRPYLRQTTLEIYNIQDSTQCIIPGIPPNRPIRRPEGVDVGHQEDLDNDLGLRFNKMPLMEDVDQRNIVDGYFPFGPDDYYPMSFSDATIVRELTKSVSVIHPKDCTLCKVAGLSPEELIGASKVKITYPSSDPTSTYWDELWEVIVVQLHRLDGKSVEDLMKLPEIWSNYDMNHVAEAVHDEFPGIHHSSHIQRLFGPGGLHKSYQRNCPSCAGIDGNIIPLPSNDEFLRGAVMLADISTWAIGVVGPPNFAVKWFVGRPRPEEVVWEIYNDRITESDGVPGYIVQTVKQRFTLSKKEDFTAYPEGSPTHPSWPAMHAAASAASLWMAVVMDLTHEQWCEIKAMDYAIGYARTVAGVHYYTDTIAGLNIGQEVLTRLLPGYLQEKYGSDPAVVAAKIERVRFDWNDYIDSDCLN